MKILRVKIIDSPNRPLLNNSELFFNSEELDSEFVYPNILIGINGSGKSQLLETIAEIFLYLDRNYRQINKVKISTVPLLFEIDYLVLIAGGYAQISVKQQSFKTKPDFRIVDEGGEETIKDEDVSQYLPAKIVGYTSGDNETLSLPFTDYYDEYAKYTGERALTEKNKSLPDYEPRFYFMDYNTNIGVLISNLLMGGDNKLDEILKYVGINSLKSFQIVIQTRHSAAPRNGVQFTTELKNWIENLRKISTCYEYFPMENKYVLDFFVTDALKTALKFYFNTPIEFYTALYKIELLNNLIVKDSHLKNIKKQRAHRKLIIKPPSVAEQDKVLNYSEIKLKLSSFKEVDYINLSDGEHQFLNIFGTILMTNSVNCLFLLDEPETHFNPTWRRDFIFLLSLVTKNRNQDFFLTSHSPFIVADSKRDKVYIFQKNDSKQLDIKWPIEETYGSDMDYILKVAFGLDSSMSRKSYDELSELITSDDSNLIQSKIDEFGDSKEKLFLFKRLEELKSK